MARYLYQPASRLMMYFMSLVSWAWVAVILSLVGIPLVPWILVPSLIAIFTVAITICVRKLDDAYENGAESPKTKRSPTRRKKLPAVPSQSSPQTASSSN